MDDSMIPVSGTGLKALIASDETDPEKQRLMGLSNAEVKGGSQTYAHRMMKKAFLSASGITGSKKCGCGRWISSNKLSCLACSKVRSA